MTSSSMKECAAATAAVLSASESMPDGTPEVKGYDFDNGTNYDALFAAMKTMGFQATNLALAIEEVEKMVASNTCRCCSCSWWLTNAQIRWRGPAPEEGAEGVDDVDPLLKTRCTIFLGFTSNMISSGVREVIKFLVKNKMVGGRCTMNPKP